MTDKPLDAGWAALSALEKIQSSEAKQALSSSDPATKLVILNSIADGVFTVDNNGFITSFNRSAEKITGFSQEEAVGKKCHEIFRANICEKNCALKKSMESGKEIMEWPIVIKDNQNQTVPICVSTAVLKNEQGEVIGGVETFRRLGNERAHRRIILDSIADGVFTVDNNFTITSFNKAAEKITGISHDEAVGKQCHEVFNADICAKDCALRKTMATGKEIIDYPVNIKNSLNQTIPTSVSTAVLKDENNNIMGGVGSFRDLSGEQSHQRIILDSIADGVFTVDNDNIITSFNRGAEKITGVRREYAVGKKCYDVFKTDICENECALKKSMESGEELFDCRVSIHNSKS